jgi:hypothetical protein
MDLSGIAVLDECVAEGMTAASGTGRNFAELLIFHVRLETSLSERRQRQA